MIKNHVSSFTISSRAYDNARHAFGEQHRQILAVLAKERIPMSASQIAQKLGHTQMVLSNIRSRILELRKAGRVVMTSPRACPISGQLVGFYRLPLPGEDVPTPADIKPTRKELLAEIATLSGLLKASERKFQQSQESAKLAIELANDFCKDWEALKEREQQREQAAESKVQPLTTSPAPAQEQDFSA